MEIKRPRGRPRKYPLTNSVDISTPESMPIDSELPVVLSIGIEKKGGLYSAFTMKTQGDRVIEKSAHQADIKESSLGTFYIMMLEKFIDPNY